MFRKLAAFLCSISLSLHTGSFLPLIRRPTRYEWAKVDMLLQQPAHLVSPSHLALKGHQSIRRLRKTGTDVNLLSTLIFFYSMSFWINKWLIYSKPFVWVELMFIQALDEFSISVAKHFLRHSHPFDTHETHTQVVDILNLCCFVSALLTVLGFLTPDISYDGWTPKLGYTEAWVGGESVLTRFVTTGIQEDLEALSGTSKTRSNLLAQPLLLLLRCLEMCMICNVTANKIRYYSDVALKPAELARVWASYQSIVVQFFHTKPRFP